MSTIQGTDGKTYELGSSAYTNYLLGSPTGVAATVPSSTPTTSNPGEPTLGTIEYTQYLAAKGNSLYGYDAFNTQTGAPTNASQVQTNPELNLSTSAVPTYGNTSQAGAFVASQNVYLAEMQKAQQQQQAEALKREELNSKSSNTLLSSLTKSLKSPSAARLEAQKETGIVPSKYFADQKARITEIDALNKEYNSVVQARDEQKAKSQDGMASMSFINNQQAQIDRNAAPRLNALSANINSKAATMQALQGNFREAQNFVNQAVQDAVADNRFKYDLFETTYRMNQDAFDRIDKIYSDSFKTGMELAKMDYERILDEKQQVGNLMLKYYESGITITDTLEQAMAKAGVGPDPYTALQMDNIRQDNARLSSETSGNGTSLNSGPTGLLQSAINSGMTADEAALDVAGYYESIGVQVDQKTINGWIASAKTLSKIEATPTSTTATFDPTNTPNPYDDKPRYTGESALGSAIKSTQSFFSNLFGI